MRVSNGIIAVSVGCVFSTSAHADTARPFAIAPGALGDALIAFGGQANLTVGVSDPALANARTKGLRGRHTIRDGLRQLLDGTGGTFLFVDQNTVRIVRAAPSKSPLRPRPAPLKQAAAPSPVVPQRILDPVDIVVTASKQNTPLSRYPGTATVIDLDPDKNAREASRGTEAIIARLPVLTSTSLGPGRDKLFIRGIADSSFNGPSQSTVGQYLGDVRLTYSAPDPNFNLYDIGRVEVLEGPQGTLYGTGSLGGTLRWVPNAPNPARLSATASVGGVTSAAGGVGNDLAAMANVPIITEKVAIRAVAYATNQPGYIDDPGRGLTDINRSKSEGGRLAILFRSHGWSVTAGGAAQNTTSNDGQYLLRGTTGLTRSSAIAQPFDNDYRLAYVSVGKDWADLQLVSTTSIVWHDIATRFDATGFPGTTGPIQFDERIANTLLAHETRLAGNNGLGTWVAGISSLRSNSVLRRDLGTPGATIPIAGVRNTHTELALFGQYGFTLGRSFVLTAGGRLTYSRGVGQLLDEPGDEAPLAAQRALRLAPTLALSWQINDRLIAFARYQKGFRAGGVEVGTTESNEKSQIFDADSLTMSELGFRLSPGLRARFSASATLSVAQWTHIQSDLVDSSGLPYTANIGDGRIYGFDAKIVWRPSDALTLEAATFLNISRLTAPAPAFAFARERELPNIAEEGAQIRGSYSTSLSRDFALTLDGSLRYVGPSELGIGFPLDVSQGNFFEAAIGARLSRGIFGLSVDVTNLGDVRGNRFAYGNPFGLSARNQITPLRPRTVRIGIDAKF